MGLLSCPWFRWGRKHPAEPNDTSCYQLARVESPTPSEEQVEGVPSSTESGSSCEHQRGSSGLAERLRRRFSRETNAGPKSTGKKARSSFLPFTPKPTNAKPSLIASDGFPSSLMSARGYDSDAQFMDTSRHLNNASESPYNSPSIWGSVSPLAQPYYETELDDPGEELAGESSLVVDGPFSDQSDLERPQLPWHPRDYPHWGPLPPITHGTDHERARKRVGSPYTTGFFENPGRYSTANRGRLLGYPGRTPISPMPCTTSVDSVYGPSSQLSIRKRRQPPPRELKSESHSIHLGNMDISKRLASPSISPRALSEKPSFDGIGHDKTTGVRSASNQGYDRTNVDTTQAPTESVQETNLETLRAKDSSSYSRRTSFSSGYSKYQFETKVFRLPDSVRETMKNPYADITSLNPSCQSEETAGDSPNIPTAATPCDAGGCASQSKSPRPYEVDPSIAPPRADLQSNAGTAALPSRQISVGWMSGGRRLGYGYTLVPADDKEDNLSSEDTCSLKTCDLNSASTVGKGHGKRSASTVGKPCIEQDNKTGSGKGLSVFEITNMMQRLNLRHWSGATTSSGANNLCIGPNNTSVTSVLWGKLGFSRKSQNEPDIRVDQKPPWSHFCGVGLDQELDRTLTPPRDTDPPVNDVDEQLSKGRTGLHRARSLWAKGRTVTDRAHGLETKLTTKIPISIKQNPGLRREKTRVIKLKNRGRKQTINNSLDEENPIFPDPKQHELLAISRVEESHKLSTGYHDRRDDVLQVTERNSSDTDLADAYEDCLEVHSIPD
ncbi:hypothetical protein BDV38DRAFT_102090 [Aspergillus pseudotamarii]|uniref:Uncharacterized protein n=1 Tax=Aspergillus pseudotamarii TaxID=132259 RepID=A0A5N6SSI7_ASPPS|nr:uncharacterized protein BDV38DRAFT_102090 [Aspergillus pseudotamarii]KAE8136837.1 hypothetical protein BDV38DRAFT_102090 [Aspergillus pseudotamarii]